MFGHIFHGVGFVFKGIRFDLLHPTSISEEDWVYMCSKFIQRELAGNMTDLEVQVSFWISV